MIGRISDFLQRLLDRLFQVDPVKLGARRHQGIDRLVTHAEDRFNDILLVFLKDTVLFPLFDHDFDLIFRDLRFFIFLDADQFQSGFCGEGKHADNREEDAGEDFDWSAHGHRDFFRIIGGDPLGDQFPDHQAEIGDERGDQQNGKRLGDSFKKRNFYE